MLTADNSVELRDGLFKSRMMINERYLEELDSEALLQNFLLEAGLMVNGIQVVDDPVEAKLHWGWEAPICQLRGHFLGHWMSAAAKCCCADDNKRLRLKLTEILDRLAECQELNGGRWVGPIPEKYFEKLIRNEYVWSPQYVMHKVLMGLTDCYAYLGDETALRIVNNLADWYTDWVSYANSKNPNAVYMGEQAGMLEIWVRQYMLTGDDKYTGLIAAYAGNPMFSGLLEGRDTLTDDHANASIPLIHGAMAMYMATTGVSGQEMDSEKKTMRGDSAGYTADDWLRIVENFWNSAVTTRGMYATTGANTGEFWNPKRMLAGYICERNQEFCTVYNMVRVAEFLYRETGETKYADYIERALYNGFLAQQNRKTGMPTYFLPLKAGSRKKWGSKTHDFWCCHGTMVQAQSSYGELIYYNDADTVYVSQYIPSECEINLSSGMVHIAQRCNIGGHNSQVLFDEHSEAQTSRWNLQFNIDSDSEVCVKFRIPAWAKGTAVSIDGSVLKLGTDKDSAPCADTLNGRVSTCITENYICITRKWSGNTVDITFKNEVVLEPLPDEPSLAALVDGPIVLAGLTDKDRGLSGKDVGDMLIERVEHTYDIFTWKQTCYGTKNQGENFELIPLYDVKDETYTVYFTINNI